MSVDLGNIWEIESIIGWSQNAAEALGMGVSVLKRICRSMGLARWPFRKRQSITHIISKTQQYLVRVRAFPPSHSLSSNIPIVPMWYL